MRPRRYHDPNALLADDSELELLAQYCGGFMTDEDAQAFERRLGDDGAFFNRVAPFLKIWFSRTPLVRAMPVVDRAPAAPIAKPILIADSAPVRRRFAVGGALAAAAVLIAALVIGTRVHAPSPTLVARTPAEPAPSVAPLKQPSVRQALRKRSTQVAQLPPNPDSIGELPALAPVAALPGVLVVQSEPQLVAQVPTVILRVPTIPVDTIAIQRLIKKFGPLNAVNGESGVAKGRWHWPRIRIPLHWPVRPGVGLPSKPPTL